MRLRPAAAVLAALLVSACSSVVGGAGHGSGPPPAPASTAAIPSSTAVSSPPTVVSSPPVTTPASSAAAPTSSPAVPAGLTPCPQSGPRAAVSCLQRTLSDFWSGQLNSVVSEPVVLDATPGQAPAPCRPGIEAGAAITCKNDLTLFVSRPFLQLIEQHFSGVDLDLALASLTSHEIGHVLQYTLHQPQIEQQHPSDSTSRFVEQQADCLSGVWAGQAARQGTLDPNRFVNDAVALIALVSDNPEIATHGTPPQRRAAIERGMAGGTAGACHLVTFH